MVYSSRFLFDGFIITILFFKVNLSVESFTICLQDAQNLCFRS